MIPDTQSQEKKDALRQMGAELIEVPAVPYKDPNNYVKYSGRLAEEWIWSHGRLRSVRVLADDAHVLAQQRWDPPGAEHGTFCRPDRHCSQW